MAMSRSILLVSYSLQVEEKELKKRRKINNQKKAGDLKPMNKI